MIKTLVLELLEAVVSAIVEIMSRLLALVGEVLLAILEAVLPVTALWALVTATGLGTLLTTLALTYALYGSITVMAVIACFAVTLLLVVATILGGRRRSRSR